MYINVTNSIFIETIKSIKTISGKCMNHKRF